MNELAKIEVYRGAQELLWTNAYNSAVSGGDLKLFAPDLQEKLGYIYLQFKQLDRYGQKLIDLTGVPGTEKAEQDFLILMKQTTTTTLKFIPKATEVIDAELMKTATKGKRKNEYLELLRKEPTTTKEDLQLMFSADWSSDTSFYMFVVGLLIGSVAAISQILVTSSNVLSSIQLITYYAELVVISGIALYAGLSRFGVLAKIRARRLHAYVEAKKTFEVQN